MAAARAALFGFVVLQQNERIADANAVEDFAFFGAKIRGAIGIGGVEDRGRAEQQGGE